MNRRQSIPGQWLIVPGVLHQTAIGSLRHLPRGSGVLLLERPRPAVARALRNLAATRALTIVVERPATAARVHSLRELTRARLRRVRLSLISPIYLTRSHPDWAPLPRMRAATLARLAGRNAIALGGMDEQRFRELQQRGFVAWAGISAWLEVNDVPKKRREKP